MLFLWGLTNDIEQFKLTTIANIIVLFLINNIGEQYAPSPKKVKLIKTNFNWLFIRHQLGCGGGGGGCLFWPPTFYNIALTCTMESRISTKTPKHIFRQNYPNFFFLSDNVLPSYDHFPYLVYSILYIYKMYMFFLIFIVTSKSIYIFFSNIITINKTWSNKLDFSQLNIRWWSC